MLASFIGLFLVFIAAVCTFLCGWYVASVVWCLVDLFFFSDRGK